MAHLAAAATFGGSSFSLVSYVFEWFSWLRELAWFTSRIRRK